MKMPLSIFSGPAIMGKQTTIHLLDYDILVKSSFLDGAFELINAAYSHTRPLYIPPSFRRLLSRDQILAELEPGSFTFVVTIPDPSNPTTLLKVIAWSSVVPQHRIPHDSREIEAPIRMDRSEDFNKPTAGVVDWELKQLCVMPEFMRQGLAGSLLQLMEEEVRRRVRRKAQEMGEPGHKKIRLMATTLGENNGPWYQKRGYTTVGYLKFPAGTLGGTAPFEMWHMDKFLD